MAYEIPVTQARAELADLINRVVYAGERVVVTRHGRPLVALVSAADLERLAEQPAPAPEREPTGGPAAPAAPSAPRPAPPVRGTAPGPREERRLGTVAEHRAPDGP
ncbi:type II toxin-antitoxin system prevent-host-death family antitoxin [Streptomyces sp. NPDC008150]|uniref:type II toxin-antitoxin system Phd/YefM family antitoxin n=1 Tax=Streptomyces sp. NPDC008150 TaxID=3364816 RepID=UPI0036E75D7C